MTRTGVFDFRGKEICLDDTVRLFNQTGTICEYYGAYGIEFNDYIDWEYIRKQIPVVTGCDNTLSACQNDNFISLWEIAWNFNCEEGVLDVVEVVGSDEE